MKQGNLEECEERIVKKICLEITKLKRDWDQNSCGHRHIDRAKLEEVQEEFNIFKQNYIKSEEEKLSLMNQVKELEEKLKQEREFRCQLSGMLSSEFYNQDKHEKVDGSLEEVINLDLTDDTDNDRDRSSSSAQTDKHRRSKVRSSKEYKKKKKSHSRRSSRVSNRSTRRSRSNSRITESSRKRKITQPEMIPLKELAYEIQERKNRRGNIVLNGFKVTDKNNIGADIVRLITTETRIIPEIKRLSEIGRGKFLLEITSLGNKIDIMKRKNDLISAGISLENDFTEREIQVQYWLESLAEQDLKMGKNTKTGYMKIRQDGVWKTWNEHLGKLVIEGGRLSTQVEGPPGIVE